MIQSSVVDHTQRRISFPVVVAKKLKPNFAKVRFATDEYHNFGLGLFSVAVDWAQNSGAG